MSTIADALQLARAGSFQGAISSLVKLRKDLGQRKFLRSLANSIAEVWPGSSDDAVKLFEAAAIAGDDSATAMYNLGAGLWAVDDSRSALDAFQAGVDGGSRDAQLALGIAALWAGDVGRGVQNLNALVGSDDEIAALAAAALGRHQVETGGVTTETIELLKRSVEIDGDYVPDLAEAYIQLDRQDEAIKLLIEQSSTANPVAPIVLGNIYEDRVGDNELAEEAFRRGIELGDAHSAYNLAALLDRRGKDSESRNALKLAARMGDSRAIERLSAS